MHCSGVVGTSLSHYQESDNVAGGFSLLMGYQSMGFWLKHILGTAGAPAGGGPDYTTEYTLAADLPEGLTMELVRGTGTAEVFEGCLINTASFSIEAGGQGILNIGEVIAETSGGRVSAGTPSYSTTDTIMDAHQFGDWNWDGDDISIQSMTINVNNNLARRQQLGSNLTKRPNRAGLIEVTADISVEVDDQIYADWLADVTDDAGAIRATSSGSVYADFEFQNFYLTNVTDAVSGPGLILANLTLACQGDGTNHGLKVTLANQQSDALGVSGRF